ncbi:MAG: hypothetical protein FJ139_01665 [Deltaproteobacteria bacterium]|nr:hypothetical protein [Deltaproteobacteria bacterium]
MNFFNTDSFNTHIVVRTGMKSFLLLDRIVEISESRIVGIRSYAGDPVYLGLESLAQLGAFFIRSLTDFSKHVFLLKIARCVFSTGPVLSGEYTFSGDLVSRSDSAFQVRLHSEKDRRKVIEGDLLFGSVEYNDYFKQETLHHHYRKVFSCLLNDSKTVC